MKASKALSGYEIVILSVEKEVGNKNPCSCEDIPRAEQGMSFGNLQQLRRKPHVQVSQGLGRSQVEGE